MSDETKVTDESKFLQWCKDQGLTPIIDKDIAATSYYLIITSLTLEGKVSMNINKFQDDEKLYVHFDKEGKCYGGSPMISNTGMSWES